MLIIKRNGNYLLPKLFVFQKTALENANHSYQRNDWITLGSVQFSCSVMSSSVWPHGLQYDKLPCPSTAPGVYSNSCPLSRDIIQPSHPLSSPSPPTFNLSQHESFQMNQFFPSGGQSIRVSALASVLPMNIQDWFPLGWTCWISAVQGTLKSLFQHHSSKALILQHSAFFIVQLSFVYMTTGKTIALTRWTFVGKVMSV